MSTETKGLSQSKTVWYIVLLGILASYIPQLEEYALQLCPDQYDELVSAGFQLLIVVLSLLGINARSTAKGGLSGLYKKQ